MSVKKIPHDIKKKENALAKSNCPNGEEHKGIPPQEGLNVVFGDVLYFLPGLQGAQLDVLTDPLHPAARARVLPGAFGHGRCCKLPDRANSKLPDLKCS